MKTRTPPQNKNIQQAFDNTIERFAGPVSNLTHRKVTLTKDENGRVTAKTEADTAFKGVLLEQGRKIREYQRTGQIDVGDAIVYVSSNESESSNIAIESVIIDGVSGDGSVSSWEVLSVLDAPDPGGSVVFYAYRVHRRHEVTLS